MKLLGGLLVSIIMEIIFWLLCPLLAMGCFVVFDLFHITQTWLQVAIVLLPFVIAAYFLWKREKETPLRVSDSSRANEKESKN